MIDDDLLSALTSGDGNSDNHGSDNSRIPEGDSPFSSYGETPF